MEANRVSLSESPNFKSILSPELKELARIFEKYSHEIRIAGGAVRDMLLDKTPADIDFATTATPDEMKEMFEKESVRMINNRGESHGTITPRILDTINFEVTTLRIDKVTDGRHAEVEFTTDWRLDANRRDLTINAMFLGLDGKLYDYFDGLTDLRNRTIRFVGNPEERIREDYLRILRYFRFYGRFAKDGNHHQEETLTAIRQNVKGLEGISGERLHMELSKILVGRLAPDIISAMSDCNVLTYCGFPAKPTIDRFRQVFDKSVLESNECKLHPGVCLAMLTSTAEEMEDVSKRLKLSRFEMEIMKIILLEDELFLGRDDDLLFFQKRFLRDTTKLPRAKILFSELMKAYGVDESNVHQFLNWNPPRFPVNGLDLSKEWNVRGKEIGRCILFLRKLWLDSDMKATEKELLSSESKNKVFNEMYEDKK